ncbi:restriction endonuclease [Paenibacillus sp. GbtcB18]|uniref:restriction endonuclease n=1 Tax=Paenibacillus sp. GbtcB18 TaxID=2824763 RepID=UPI001C301FE3|nr:restriction endonuclease [Paenibacillus sp. GbtcB18]
MPYSETDIDFRKITPIQFEELCFELLGHIGFKKLLWRQGGADNGRDIEGISDMNNQLVGSYEEKWFFECKHQSGGISPEQLNSKFAWADAEKPQHVAILTTTYLTNGCRVWIEKIRNDKAYRIHIIEGKQLTSLVLGYSDIISTYFIDESKKLLLDVQRNWLFHNLIPGPDTFLLLSRKITPSKLTKMK